VTPKSLSRFALVMSTALVLVLTPVSPLDNLILGGTEAFAKSKGNSGNANKNKGGGNSQSSRSKSSKSSNSGNAGAGGNSGQGGSSSKNKHATTTQQTQVASPSDTDVEDDSVAPVPQVSPKRNLHAQLGGLNSLKRNINGMMNSSDPRMEGIREYILASAESEQAQLQAELAEAATADAGAALGDYLSQLLIDNGYEGSSLADLENRLAELEGAPLLDTDEGFEEWQAEVDKLTATLELLATDETLQGLQSDLSDAELLQAEIEAAAAELGEASSDESLIAALLLAANDNRIAESGDDYLTPELLEWARQVLGVGEYDGLIDDYAASTSGEEAPVDPDAIVEEDVAALDPEPVAPSI